ncbi:uncharacterized protein [Apostichopus japonicus]|uniref:uncharacterized protein n=1 Tax=Stichopus japonicus TaxID=307972 RepID=UPI003AB8A5C3
MMEQGQLTRVVPPICQGAYIRDLPRSLQEIQGANLSPGEKLNQSRERNRECAAIRRAYMPTDKLEMERKRGREYMALKRAFMTPKEKELENKKNRERVRLKRMYLPEEKKELIRKQQRERLARKRAQMTPEEKSRLRERWRIQMKEKRASLSEEEKARLRTYNREKAREYRTRKHQDTGFPGAWASYTMFQAGSEQNITNCASTIDQSMSSEKLLTLPAFPTPLNDQVNSLSNVAEGSRHSVVTKQEIDADGSQVAQQLTNQSETESSLIDSLPQEGDNQRYGGTFPQLDSLPVDSNHSGAILPAGIQKPFQIVYKAVHKFRRFCFDTHQTEEFECLDKATVNDLLAGFYSKVEQLPWMGLQMTEFLVIMKEGLACFMRDFLQTDIINDPAFEKANTAFVRRLETLLQKTDPQNSEGTAKNGEALKEASETLLVLDEEVTMRVVQFFQKYLVHQGKNINFETFTKESLIEALHGFYVYAKMIPQKSLPEPYRILRLRLAHHIKTKMNVDIIHDPDFEFANRVCKANMTKLEQHLQGAPLEVEPVPGGITCQDLITLFQSPNMTPSHPQGLLNLCMFNVIFYLCQSITHGLSESMRLMDKGTFLFETDEQNNEYVAWQSTYQERMPELVGHSLCPVSNLNKYLAKLSSDSSSLWQHPIRRSLASYSTMEVWYQVNIPMGSRKIQYFMEKLSQEAGLGTCYSNLSIQQTPLETMNDALRAVKDMFSFVGPDNFSLLPNQDQSRQQNTNQPISLAESFVAGNQLPLGLVSSLSDLDNHLNCVMWSKILPDWNNLKMLGKFENNVDFLKHLLNIYNSCISDSYPDDALPQIGPNTIMHPEVGERLEEDGFLSVASSSLNSERHEKGRRLDAVLASSLKTLGDKERQGTSSRRKPSIVQRKENYPALDGKDEEDQDHPLQDAEGMDHPLRDAEGMDHPLQDAEGREHPLQDAEGMDHPLRDAEGRDHLLQDAEGRDHPSQDAEGRDHPLQDAEGRDHPLQDAE